MLLNKINKYYYSYARRIKKEGVFWIYKIAAGIFLPQATEHGTCILNRRLKKLLSCVCIWAVLLPFLAKPVEAFLDPDPQLPKNLNEVPMAENTKLVAFLVGKDLLSHKDVADRIEQYGQDVQRDLQARVVQIPISYDASPLEIYEGLSHLYFSGLHSDGKSQLIGTVLIGEVPLPVVEKNGNTWPTVFPYTDFEDPMYQWNEAQNQFVAEGRGQEPEIWHGVIRSGTDGRKAQLQELEAYFDRNHAAREGDVQYAKKVFWANFVQQKEMLSEFALNNYKRWIKYAEDISYLRYNKKLLKKLTDEVALERQATADLYKMDSDKEGNETFNAMLDDIYTPIDPEAMEDLPDIQVKELAESFLMRYQEVYKNWGSLVSGAVNKSGRWTADDLDATATLLSRKDEYSIIILRALNDQWEQVLIEKLEAENIPETIGVSVGETLLVQETDENGDLVYDDTALPIIQPVMEEVEKPLYWNGVKRADMDVEDCSLIRGSKVGDRTPFAQMVDMNRVFNDETEGDCAADDASTTEKNEDLYEGCCATNKVETNGELDYVRCDLGSEWDVVDNEPVHYGAEKEVFDYNGGREIVLPQGAEGCEEIIQWDGGENTFSSLMVHDEPRPATLMAQVKNGGANLLPVDDPRGVSYYDHGKNFRRIAFPNIFDYRDPTGKVLSSAALKSVIIEMLHEKIREINQGVLADKTASGTLLREDLLDEVIEKVGWDKIYESLTWIDKDIAEKNRIILEKNFAPKEERGDFLLDEEAEGYELLEIVSEGHPTRGIKMAFSADSDRGDAEYLAVLDSLLGFKFDEPPIVKLDELDSSVSKSEKKSKKPVPSFLKKPAQLVVSPDEIRVAANDPAPIPIEVQIRNKRGDVMIEDFETKVRLNFSHREVGKFFTILPAQERHVRAGVAKFTLIPKVAENVGGVFSFTASTEDLETEPMKLEVVRYGLKILPPLESVSARMPGGALFQVQVLDLEQKLSNRWDGRIMKFQSEFGDFEGGQLAAIQDGVAKIRFYPYKKAGRASITVSDIDDELPIKMYEFDIFPGKPALLKLETPSPQLIKDGEFVPVSVQITDKHGNSIDQVRHTLNWDFDPERFEVRNFKARDQDANTSGMQEFLREGDSRIFLQAKKKTHSMRIEVTSDILPPDRGQSFSYKVIESPYFDIKVDQDFAFVGSEEPVKVTVWGKDAKGRKLEGEFDINVTPFPVDTAFFPSQFKIQNGRGEFEFFAGTKPGKIQVSIHKPGFETREFEFAVVPEPAKKIILSTEKKSIDVETLHPILIDVKAVDRFGNVVQTNETVSVRLTEDTEHLLKLEKGSVTLKNGKGVIKAWTQGKLGNPHLIAEREGVIPDVLELQIWNYFSVEDLIKLSPKSFLSLILGFGAGDARYEGNFANRFLFTGDTQAVGTLIADPEPGKKQASFSPAGFVSGQVKMGFLSGKFPEVALFTTGKDEELAAKVRFLYKQNVELFLNKKMKLQQGVYFDSATERGVNPRDISGVNDSGIKVKDNIVHYEGNPIFQLTEKGGILIDSDQVSIQPTKNFRIWQVFFDKQLLGSLEYVTGSAWEVVEKFVPEGASRIQLKSLKPGLEFDQIFIGNSTHTEKGWALIDTNKKEIDDKKLGSLKESAEDAIRTETVGWSGNWKIASLFASENTIGDSARSGSSDAFILLGDPTLSLPPAAEDDRGFGFKRNLGTPIWSSPDDPVDQLIAGDVNGDGILDLLPRVEDKLYVLYQSQNPLARTETREREKDYQLDPNFRDGGPILRFADGVKSLIDFDNDQDGYVELIQLNEDGKLILHENTAGVFSREVLDLGGLEENIEILKSGELNGDRFLDLAFVTPDNDLYVAFGHKEGFFRAQKFDNFAPDFQEIEEEFKPLDEEVAKLDSNSPENPYPQLSSLLVSFAGMETEDENIAESDKLVEFATGEGGTLSARPFMPVIQNERFETTFTAKIDKETNKIQKGDKIQVAFTIRPNGHITDFEFQPAQDDRLELVPGSVKCTGCRGHLKLRPIPGNGLFWAYGIELPKAHTAKITWRLRAKSVPVIDFFIGDFEDGADDIDDIAIPWTGTDGEERMIEYLSSEQPDITGLRAGNIGGSIIAFNPKQRISPNLPPEETISSEEYDPVADEDQDADGIPDSHDHYPHVPNEPNLNYAQKYLKNLKWNLPQCGGGECNSVTAAWVEPPEEAPGLMNDFYHTVFPKPVSLDPIPGFPDVCKPPKVPPICWQSTYRKYIMPLSNGKVGEASCSGVKTAYMKPPIKAGGYSQTVRGGAGGGRIDTYFDIAPDYLLRSIERGNDLYIDDIKVLTIDSGGGVTTHNRTRIGTGTRSSWGSNAAGVSYVGGEEKNPVYWKGRLIGWLGKVSIAPRGGETINGQIWKRKWKPNCKLKDIPPVPRGICPKGDPGKKLLLASAANIDQGSRASLFNVSGQRIINGVFTMKVANEKNIVTGGDDVGTLWLQDQVREIGANASLASLSVQFPSWLRHYLRYSVPPDFLTDRGGIVDLTFAALSNIPFLEVKVKNISIPYAEFTREEISRWERYYEQWLERAPSLGFTSAEIQQHRQAFDHNKEVINKYSATIIDEYYNLRIRQERLLVGLIDNLEILSEYLDTWVASVEAGLDMWYKAEQMLLATLATWQSAIVDPFLGFAVGCRTCVLDRGTLLPWLLRVFVDVYEDQGLPYGWMPYPVVEIERVPDVKIDYSNIVPTFSVEILNPVMKPMELTLFELFPLPAEEGKAPPEVFQLPNYETPELDIPPPLDFKLPKLLQAPTQRQPLISLRAKQAFQSKPIPSPPISKKLAEKLDEAPMPAIPEPPQIPDLLGPMSTIVGPLFGVMGFFCDLRQNFLIVSEWYLKPHTEQIGNRESVHRSHPWDDWHWLHHQHIGTLGRPHRLMNKEDYVTASLGFLFPSKTITMQGLEDVGTVLSKFVDNVVVRKRDKTGDHSKVIPPVPGAEIEALLEQEKREKQERLEGIRKKEFDRKKEEESDATMTLAYLPAEKLIEKMKTDAKAKPSKNIRDYALKKQIFDIELPADKSLDTPLRKNVYQGLQDRKTVLASLRGRIARENKILKELRDLPVGDFFQDPEVQTIVRTDPNYLATTKKTSTLFDNGPVLLAQANTTEDEPNIPEVPETEIPTSENPVGKGLYFFDHESGTSGEVMFAPEGKVSPLLIDLDGDLTDEIVYSMGRTIYFKERFAKARNPIPIKNIEKLGYKEFLKFYNATRSHSVQINSLGADLNLKPTDSETKYFEWIHTDRPDYFFEFSEKPENRKSKIWHRTALQIREQISNAKARKTIAHIKSMSGKPKLVLPPTEKIQKFKSAFCEDSKYQKPIFMEATTFIAKRDAQIQLKWISRSNERQKIYLEKGQEIQLSGVEVCVTDGELLRLKRGSGEIVEEIDRDQFLTAPFTLELAPADQLLLEFFDGSLVTVWGGENYELHQVQDAESIHHFQALPQKNHYGFLSGRKGQDLSSIQHKLLLDPQVPDDREPPQISIVGGFEHIGMVGQKIVINASPTTDNGQITRVWWDLNAKQDRDGDGDPDNDQDFPPVDKEFPPVELLVVKLPPKKAVEKYQVVLHVEDASGNHSQETLDISVEVPDLELQVASVDDHRLKGVIKNKFANIPIWFNRKRKGYELLVRKDPVHSDKDGVFQIDNLSTEGGLEIIEKKTDKVVVEILETGRPVIYDNRFGFSVQPATEMHPMRIRIRDRKNQPVMTLDFEANGDKRVKLLSEMEKINLYGNDLPVQVLDKSSKDRYRFQEFPETTTLSGHIALIDTKKYETLGVIDPRGDLYLVEDSGISLGIKKTTLDTEPVVFEIFGNEDLIGELFVPVVGELEVR